MDQQTGKYLLVAGILIVIVGLLIYFFHTYFKWIGRLPGDIRIERQNFKFYFPITTMIIFSLIATLLFSIFKKLF
jgi:H+/Cl- antiporter ClcA